jgi:hypothetical protein
MLDVVLGPVLNMLLMNSHRTMTMRTANVTRRSSSGDGVRHWDVLPSKLVLAADLVPLALFATGHEVSPHTRSSYVSAVNSRQSILSCCLPTCSCAVVGGASRRRCLGLTRAGNGSMNSAPDVPTHAHRTHFIAVRTS